MIGKFFTKLPLLVGLPLRGALVLQRTQDAIPFVRAPFPWRDTCNRDHIAG